MGPEVNGFSKLQHTRSVNILVLIVSFDMQRSRPGHPALTIEISAERGDPEKITQMLLQAAQEAIKRSRFRSHRWLVLQNDVSSLVELLRSMVDLISEKMDVLAEVCLLI